LTRTEEYRHLLTLLNPDRYEFMDFQDFQTLQNKQKQIIDTVYEIARDINDYVKFDLSKEVAVMLAELNKSLNDINLEKMILKIQTEDCEKSFETLKIILSYISTYYQIEYGVIRHRKKEIQEVETVRKLITAPYTMAGEEYRIFESNIYVLIMNFLENSNPKIINVNMKKKLLGAMMSSPFALQTELSSQYHISSEINEIIDLNMKWADATRSLIRSGNTKKTGYFSSKFQELIRLIENIGQSDINAKLLVFTGFRETAIELEKLISKKFGGDYCAIFTSDLSAEEMQHAVEQYQDSPACKVMICDESGGEGRNFQMAKYIIHFDLPWSPALLEQRIGRLDRIGRLPGMDVVSVVIYARDTIEEDLFRLFSEGLNVFQASLCGMEIALEDIQSVIEKSIGENIRYGLANSIEIVRNSSKIMFEEIEKEEYFDTARQMDKDLKNRFDNSIQYFTEGDSEQLMEAMIHWPEMAGYREVEYIDPYRDYSFIVRINTENLSEGSRYNSLYTIPKGLKFDRSRSGRYIHGTFSRETAVNHESISFFAPRNPMFESITQNAIESYRGRSCAFKLEKCKVNFSGLILTWNASFNYAKVNHVRVDLDLLNNIIRFLPTEQFIDVVPLHEEYSHISAEEVILELETRRIHDPIHLGERGNGAIKVFQDRFPPEKWQNYIRSARKKSNETSREHFLSSIDLTRAKEYLEKIFIAEKAKNLFFGFSIQDNVEFEREIIDVLMYGLEHPIIELDSIAFVLLRK